MKVLETDRYGALLDRLAAAAQELPPVKSPGEVHAAPQGVVAAEGPAAANGSRAANGPAANGPAAASGPRPSALGTTIRPGPDPA